MADIGIAIVAKNEATSAIAKVNADLAGLAKQAQETGNAFVSIGKLQLSLGTGTTAIKDLVQDLQNATEGAKQLGTTLSESTKIRNAGGVETVSASIRQAEAELQGLLKTFQQLAKEGKLDFGAGTSANLSQAQAAIGQQLAALKALKTESIAAGKAGILGDGASAARQINEATRTSQLLTQTLKNVEGQAGKTGKAVENIGKGGALSGIKNEVAELDRAFGSLGNALTGNAFGVAAGAIGFGATALAIGQISGAITDAVQAAGRLDKLRNSFDQLAEAAGQSGEQMLTSMRAASFGMVSDADLILSANKAMLLGVADTGEELGALLNVARVRGQAMGLDVSQAFNDITIGLGRLSPRILDNLGIVIDETKVYGEYAATLSKTAAQLSENEKRQALLNAVIDSSGSLTAKAPTGAGAAIAQSQVASANAQVAAGEAFAPLVRDAAQAYGDAIQFVQGKLDTTARAQRELNDAIADGQLVTSNAVVVKLDPQQTAAFQELSASLVEADAALAAGTPHAAEYQASLQGINAAVIANGRITQQQVNLMQLNVSGLREEAQAYEAARKAGEAANPMLDALASNTRKVATAEEQAAAAANLAKFSVDALTNAMAPGAAAAQALASGLSQVQAQAGATAGVIYNLANAQAQLANVSNKNLAAPDALDRVLPQINNLGTTLVAGGLNPTQALDKIKELKIEAAGITREMEAQGASDDEIFLALSANVQETQKWASSLGQVSDEAIRAKEQFENIQGKVAGLISEAQNLPSFKAGDLFNASELTAKGLTGDSQISIDQAANGGVRPDAINENARRLMAIAKEGFQDQPWLEEFKKEVPAVFAELQNNPDIRGAALNILQQFEQGLRPELLDQSAIKDRVKQMILGEQNAAALAEQIAQEIAQEMGVSLPQALAASREALGVGSAEGAGASADIAAPDLSSQGSAAGVTFRAGMVAGFDAKGMTGEILVKIDAEFNNPKNVDALKKSGGAVGAVWGMGFLNTVGANIPPGLYDVLVGGLVPLIVAAIGAQGTRTGAQP